MPRSLATPRGALPKAMSTSTKPSNWQRHGRARKSLLSACLDLGCGAPSRPSPYATEECFKAELQGRLVLLMGAANHCPNMRIAASGGSMGNGGPLPPIPPTRQAILLIGVGIDLVFGPRACKSTRHLSGTSKNSCLWKMQRPGLACRRAKQIQLSTSSKNSKPEKTFRPGTSSQSSRPFIAARLSLST